MNAPKDDLFHAMRGTADLVACVVQTLNESDQSFQERFLEKLTDAYYHFRDNPEGEILQELELLSWTRGLLTGFSWTRGQGKPFLDD
jgi:hypothetical protein